MLLGIASFPTLPAQDGMAFHLTVHCGATYPEVRSGE
jgi:hypothetical protein